MIKSFCESISNIYVKLRRSAVACRLLDQNESPSSLYPETACNRRWFIKPPGFADRQGSLYYAHPLSIGEKAITIDLMGYCDRFSVRPGQSIRFMVSSDVSSYGAELVRLRHLDTSPEGPGFKYDAVASDISGEYAGRSQNIHTGSAVTIQHHQLLNCTDGFTLHAWIYPTTPQKGIQGLLSKWSDRDRAGYCLFIDDEGGLALALGDGAGQPETISTGVGMKKSHWYSVAATCDTGSGEVCLFQEPMAPWPVGNPSASVRKTVRPQAIGISDEAFLIAARGQTGDDGKTASAAHFNGKIDSPSLYSCALPGHQIEQLRQGNLGAGGDALVAGWNFSIDISSQHVTDTSPNHLDGRTLNMPMRAAIGHNWKGSEVDFRNCPSEYGAIHFHDDDLEDAAWDVAFEWTVPETFPSGIYAAQLTSGDAVDYVPFAVSPGPDQPRTHIAFLAPSLTYLAYANQQYNDPMRAELGLADSEQIAPADQYMRDHKLMSLYDMHCDGTGVCYSSRLRPILNMKPGYRNAPMSLAAGWPHGLNADMHLLDWMDAKSFEYDVISDDDLHLEGAELLAPYCVIVTGTHPEYWTRQMLDAMSAYQSRGGRLIYLGGNGFYWVTSFDPERPHLIEVRRFGGSRPWEAVPGEYHHSTTGELGGNWRLRNRAPQKLSGVGWVATGSGVNRPYRRNQDSFDARAAFIFAGVGDDELIGDFPSLVYGHGAAGFEIDRHDHALGTPEHALVLASSFEHSDDYQLALEDQLASGAPTDGSQNPLVHADMVYYEGPDDGAVFSVGSISWCGSLSYNGYDNNVSRITENVLRRFSE